MKAEIISVGTELLLGDILNTNAQYIGRQLMLLGIDTYRQVTVGDNPQRLREELVTALKNVDVVITTGGLGPTNDDLTKDVCTEVLELEPVLHEPSYRKLLNYFGDRKDKERLLAINRNQAMFPKDAIVIENGRGTAPGAVLLGKNGKKIILLPGPPSEMIPMFEDFVFSYLRGHSDAIMVSRVLKVTGMGEGDMAKAVEDIMMESTNPTVAPYSNSEGLLLRITAKDVDEAVAREHIAKVESKLRERLGSHIYGVDTDTRAGVAVAGLMERGWSVATAESLTGGLVASALIEVPGASRVLGESFIVYSDEAKSRILGVKPETLEKFTAVSEEVCREMLYGLSRVTGADVCIATTGYAGPSGEDVGFAYIGLLRGENIRIIKGRFGLTRAQVRARVTNRAVDMIIEEVR